jgi:hypothetical protein
MSWTSYTPLRYEGETYGKKDVEFGRFLQLPKRNPSAIFEVALGGLQHAQWETAPGGGQGPDGTSAPRPPESAGTLLQQCGWAVVDPLRTCATLDEYRNYIQCSRAEWSVAKNGYVKGRTGWFSGRSANYLAAGKPVVVQDTGFSRVLPVGTGIVPFTTFDEAVDGVRNIESAYTIHCQAARAIAEDHFAAATVLTKLIEEAAQR